MNIMGGERGGGLGLPTFRDDVWALVLRVSHLVHCFVEKLNHSMKNHI